MVPGERSTSRSPGREWGVIDTRAVISQARVQAGWLAALLNSLLPGLQPWPIWRTPSEPLRGPVTLPAHTSPLALFVSRPWGKAAIPFSSIPKADRPVVYFLRNNGFFWLAFLRWKNKYSHCNKKQPRGGERAQRKGQRGACRPGQRLGLQGWGQGRDPLTLGEMGI